MLTNELFLYLFQKILFFLVVYSSMLKKPFIYFSSMFPITEAVANIDSQRIPRKFLAVLVSKLRQAKQKFASNLEKYSNQSHLQYHAALKDLFGSKQACEISVESN